MIGLIIMYTLLWGISLCRDKVSTAVFRSTSHNLPNVSRNVNSVWFFQQPRRVKLTPNYKFYFVGANNILINRIPSTHSKDLMQSRVFYIRTCLKVNLELGLVAKPYLCLLKKPKQSQDPPKQKTLMEIMNSVNKCNQ